MQFSSKVQWGGPLLFSSRMHREGPLGFSSIDSLDHKVRVRVRLDTSQFMALYSYIHMKVISQQKWHI